MDALAAGKPVDASQADVARAVQLLVAHRREMAEINHQQVVSRLHAQMANAGRGSKKESQAVDCGGDKVVADGRGVYLDKDIVELWAAERSPAAKTKDSYRRVAEWLHERIGRKSVEQFTRKDILAFKDRLLADGQTPQNVNVKLGNLRTLLQWAVENDYAESNPAMGIVLKAPANKRMTYGLADLQSLFSSPVFTDGARPKQGRGEAAYWLPVLALFTGARMEELGQLRVGDIKEVSYPDADNEMRSCWGLHFVADTDDNGQVTRLKNAESERFVPLHPELERLGFLKYVEGLSDKKGRVFPELRAGAYGRQTAKWGEWYGRYVDSDTGITDKRITFHSFRHTFKDYCRLASIEEPLANRLMGHKTQGVAASYGLGYGLHNLVQAVLRYKVPGLGIPSPMRTGRHA
ncbi:Tyrosine recombinase XerD [Sphingobium sp. AntQ-1]|nr:Tyrosine recombinase XerD [Sphingobium sp. AntQ-1]